MEALRMSEEINLPPGFSRSLPSIQNTISIFGNWTSVLPIPGVNAGNVPLFSAEQDPRPAFAREVFGPLDRLDILELGSFEGGHTYQLERLGARSVLGIEASAESFLKALVIKEILGLKAQFIYGDFIKYLETIPRKYDLIFAAGVLYHMTDPLHLLHLIAEHTDRVFIWTCYILPETPFNTIEVNRYGVQCQYHRYVYDPQMHGRHYSGVETYCCRLFKADIIRALQAYGFDNVRIMKDEPESPGCPSMSLVAYKSAPDAI
jgi:hypothetical protein